VASAARQPRPDHEADVSEIEAGTAGDASGAALVPGELEHAPPVNFSPPTLDTRDGLLRLGYRIGLPAAMLAGERVPRGRRLLATVANSVSGERTSGTALRAGHFLVHGTRTRVEDVDFTSAAHTLRPLDRMVHSFSWLADLEACAPREQVAPIAERILSAWFVANAEVPRGRRRNPGAAWQTGIAAQRVLNWLAHAPLILSGDKGLCVRTLAAAEETARWLERTANRAGDGLDRTAAWCAVVAAGLLLPGGKPRRLAAEAQLVRALGELVGGDGGVLSRSPALQMEAIALLVKLRCCYRATRRDPVEPVEAVIAMMIPPLQTVRQAGGGLCAWQGGSAVGGERVDAILTAAGTRTRPLREAGQWGYQRAEAGPAVLVLDAAPPPEARHARCGCASTLAFEFGYGSQRIVTSCGGAAAAGASVPQHLEQALRASAAQSALVLEDTNSSAVLLKGEIGAGVTEVRLMRGWLSQGEGGPAARIEARHDGYVSRYALVHRRVLLLADDGRELVGEDQLIPAGRSVKRGNLAFAIRFHLAGGVRVSLDEDARAATLSLPDASTWRFLPREGEVSVEESVWTDAHGQLQPARQIVLQGKVSRGGGAFIWAFQREN